MGIIKTVKHHINIIRSKFRDIGVKERRSGKWGALEKKFLSEHPACEVCGSKSHLQIHHKKPFHIHPELELDENNLITLCMNAHECHLKIGHGGSFRSYNANIEEDVKTLKQDLSKFDEIAALAKKNRKSN